MKNTRGITLIALVITIIVLLILAGVSIAMLTGQNGILTQAKNAKEANDTSATDEKIKLIAAIVKMQAEEETLNADKLVEEITKSYGGEAIKSENDFPIIAKIDGKSLEINSEGNAAINKNIEEITGNEEINVITQDTLGNKIMVPDGFKVVNPNDNVTKGIIIEDVNHEATKGSQFVWIPLGDIIKEDKTITNVELNRYTFDNTGKETKQDAKLINNYYTEELKDSISKNIHAKDIEKFKDKVKSSYGYYIGRYEARTTTQRTWYTSDEQLEQVTSKPNDYVYNYVTQQQAALLSRGMYSETTFESDLINGYAWDTAILFLQKFDNRSNKENLKVYSKQNSINVNDLAIMGTNNIENKDEICNVYDMASNCLEWTTTTCGNEGVPCTLRGGSYNYINNMISSSYCWSAGNPDKNASFRIIIYI